MRGRGSSTGLLGAGFLGGGEDEVRDVGHAERGGDERHQEEAGNRIFEPG